MADLTKREKRLIKRIHLLEKSVSALLGIVNEVRPHTMEEMEGIIYEAYSHIEAKPTKEWARVN